MRAYDPSVRGFLSTDPLAPVLGAGWDGNPYAYAGNNPLNATDPTGQRPLTDAELKAYDGSVGGSVVSAVGDWWKGNWEYVAGGAMVVAGGALMATGVGGPVGMMLIGAGADTIIQKATTGDVNWGQVALTGAVGLVAGPLAGRVDGLVASGVGRAGTAVTSRLLPAAGRIGSAAVSGASRAGAAVSAVSSRAGSAVASGVSRVGSSVGGYVARLPGRQMVRSAVSNGIGGGAVNTGMYYGTHTSKGLVDAGRFGSRCGRVPRRCGRWPRRVSLPSRNRSNPARCPIRYGRRGKLGRRVPRACHYGGRLRRDGKRVRHCWWTPSFTVPGCFRFGLEFGLEPELDDALVCCVRWGPRGRYC
ncbi:RHS repeat-associated core domain-containing protein [Paeniglutamicibacter sulfureus]|uniref:RHS repeat-associated core domain-containing protein n=1 Tax=Paeniglutamicibacter sulfureus TaxID=43666 RepID=UPI00366F8947